MVIDVRIVTFQDVIDSGVCERVGGPFLPVWLCEPNMRPQEGRQNLTVCTWVPYA